MSLNKYKKYSNNSSVETGGLSGSPYAESKTTKVRQSIDESITSKSFLSHLGNLDNIKLEYKGLPNHVPTGNISDLPQALKLPKIQNFAKL